MLGRPAGEGPTRPPPPPPTGTTFSLPTITVTGGTRLVRLNRRAFPDPAYFGRNALHRFDAPDRSYGVCYMGTSLDCVILEVLFDPVADRRPRPSGMIQVTKAELKEWYATSVLVREPLECAWLADDGISHLRIDLRVPCGDDYRLARDWSLAIHGHDAQADGIFYPSRHHNGLYSIALFERARAKVEMTRIGALGDRRHKALFTRTVEVLRRFKIEPI